MFTIRQINKRKDIKISAKLLISIATFIGSGLYYLAIFIYMLVRLLKAKKTNISVN